MQGTGIELDPLIFEQDDPQMAEKVCAFAKARRLSLGVSSYTITAITGIDQGHISRIENFKRPNVSFNHLARLLVELNCRIVIQPL